jgi:hypothetical protein
MDPGERLGPPRRQILQTADRVALPEGRTQDEPRLKRQPVFKPDLRKLVFMPLWEVPGHIAGDVWT